MADTRKPGGGGRRPAGGPAGGTTTRRPPAPPARKGRAAEDPGLLTRIERVARSFGVELPRAPKGEAVASNVATEAAGFLASDPAAQKAAGVVIVLLDADGAVLRERRFGRRPRTR